MHIHLTLDDQLVNEAFRLTQVHTNQELIHLALQELISHHQPKNLFDLAGKIEFQENYDYKSVRTLRQNSD
jgi:Arc/MetJ family transcription regulator